MEMPLTDLQERFALEYLVDLNATRAAERAGSAAQNLTVAGSEFLANPNIAARIAEMQAERASRTKIDADWLLKRLADEATANIADLYDDDGALKSVHDWPEIWRIGLVQGMDVEERYEGRGEERTQVVTRKIKISDRVKRLELIGKHIGVQAFRENVAVSGDIAVTISSTDARL
jgi:phage terminase small subunit